MYKLKNKGLDKFMDLRSTVRVFTVHSCTLLFTILYPMTVVLSQVSFVTFSIMSLHFHCDHMEKYFSNVIKSQKAGKTEQICMNTGFIACFQ